MLGVPISIPGRVVTFGPISRHVCYSLDTIFKDISSIITILRVFLETFLAGNKLTNVTFTKILVGCV